MNDGGAAFGHGAENGHCCGATLRDYFACHAPAVPEWFYKINGKGIDEQRTHALWGYSYADAMLKQRKVSND
jgi:hypothetical protein